MSLLLAAFRDEHALTAALVRMRGAGIAAESYTAAPLESDPPVSVLPLVILAAGVLTAAGVFAMQAYATMISYPVDIGGRPYFSWPAYVPMAFEMGVLAAVAAGVVGFLVANRLPHLYDPIDESDAFREATRDGFFLAVRDADTAQIRVLLESLTPLQIEELAREQASGAWTAFT